MQIRFLTITFYLRSEKDTENNYSHCEALSEGGARSRSAPIPVQHSLRMLDSFLSALCDIIFADEISIYPFSLHF